MSLVTSIPASGPLKAFLPGISSNETNKQCFLSYPRLSSVLSMPLLYFWLSQPSRWVIPSVTSLALVEHAHDHLGSGWISQRFDWLQSIFIFLISASLSGSPLLFPAMGAAVPLLESSDDLKASPYVEWKSYFLLSSPWGLMLPVHNIPGSSLRVQFRPVP